MLNFENILRQMVANGYPSQRGRTKQSKPVPNVYYSDPGLEAAKKASKMGQLQEGPKACNTYIQQVYRGIHPIPGCLANDWEDWFRQRKGSDWIEIENDGSSLKPGDVIVATRPKGRRGHLQIVGKDGSSIYDANLDKRPPSWRYQKADGQRVGAGLGGRITIWRPVPKKPRGNSKTSRVI